MTGFIKFYIGNKKPLNFNIQFAIYCISLILLSLYLENNILKELLPIILEEANIVGKDYISQFELTQLFKAVSKHLFQSLHPDYNLKLFYKHIIAFVSLIAVISAILYKLYFRKKEVLENFKAYLLLIAAPGLFFTFYILFIL